MSEFDFSADILDFDSDGFYKPSKIEDCKFDEVIPFRKAHGESFLPTDVERINASIVKECDNLVKVYETKVSYNEATRDWLIDVKDYMNGRDFNDDSVENSYKSDIIERGFTPENIDEHIDKAKQDIEDGKQTVKDAEKDFYERVWKTEGELCAASGHNLDKATFEYLGSSYEAFRVKKLKDHQAKMESRMKRADNLTSNIVKETEDDKQKE